MKKTYVNLLVCISLCLFNGPGWASPEDSSRTVDLIYFGNSLGVSAHQSYSNIHDLRLNNDALRVSTKGPYAYTCSGFTLAGSEPLTVVGFQRALTYFLSPSAVVSETKTHNGYLSPFEAILNTSPAPGLTTVSPALTEKRWLSKLMPGAQSPRLFYGVDTPFTTLTSHCTEPEAWQIRFVTHAGSNLEDSNQILVVRRPFGDGLARSNQLFEFLETHTQTRPTVISAGNNFEGLSFLHPNAPDRQRANTLKSLELLKTDVIMMGASERRFGSASFKTLVKPTGISSIDVVQAELRIINGKRLLMVNLNPGALDITDLAKSVQQLVDVYRNDTQNAPDLVIGFGILGQNQAHALQTRNMGLDVLIWQFDGVPYIAQNMTFDLTLPTRRPVSLLPVGKACWGRLSINFIANGTLKITQSTHPIFSTVHTAKHEQLIALSRQVNLVRQTAFKTQQTPFIEHIPAQFQTKAGWRKLAAITLKEHLNTDISVLDSQPVPWSIHSPILRLNAVANLPISDTASIVTIGGSALKKALSKGLFSGRVVSGLDLSAQKVGGRSINHRRTYSIATSQIIAERITQSVKVIEHRDLSTEAQGSNEPSGAFIQTMILDAMPRVLNERYTGQSQPTKVPEWYLDLSQLTVEGGRLHRVGNPDEYGDVSEPRLTIKDHQQLAVRGKVAIGYDSDALIAVNYVDWAFAQSFLEGSPAQETDDRLDIGNELVLSSLRIIGEKAAPFFRTAYLTEFTAAEIEGPNRRKSRVESVLGSLWQWDKKNQARLGLSVAADLASEPVEPQFGLYGQFEVQRRLFGLQSFAKGELRYLPPNLQQLDSRQLQLYGDTEIGVLLPVWRRLSIRSYVGGFYYQSDERYNRTPGFNLRGGLALSLDLLVSL